MRAIRLEQAKVNETMSCPWCIAGVQPGESAPRPSGQYCSRHVRGWTLDETDAAPPPMTAGQTNLLDTLKRAGKPVHVTPERRRTADALVRRGLVVRVGVGLYSAVAALCMLAGLASAEPQPITTPEPEPAARSCFGVQPICVGGYACCQCDNYGNNCGWSCCK